MRVPLLGGLYTARSRIANYQRCVNYYPEINRKDSPSPLTHYQRPGLVPVVQGPRAPVRAIYLASNGQGFCVIGQIFYSISQGFQLMQLGQLQTVLNTPVSMSDNGSTLVIADGSQRGYQFDLKGVNGFGQIIDASGTFVGANKWEYMDTFLLWNLLNTNQFGSTKSNVLTFDPLYVAAKTTYPDKIVSMVVFRHMLLLLGQFKSELWYNAGGALFPFAQNTGTYIEHGCIAPYSVAQADISAFWLSQDKQGVGLVLMQSGADTQRISNHAVEAAIQDINDTVGISDAIGYTYQQGGHVFYVLCFPAGDRTLVYDSAVGDPSLAWHERAWTDGDGNLHRDRSNCYATLYGKPLVGDWLNGTIYMLNRQAYTDTVDGNVCPLTCIRGFPQLAQANDGNGQLVDTDGKEVTCRDFTLDLETGVAPLLADGVTPAQVSMRYSNDRGRSWSDYQLRSAGPPGEYKTRPNWKSMGQGQDFVFEISHAINGPAALNGAFIQAQVCNQ